MKKLLKSLLLCFIFLLGITAFAGNTLAKDKEVLIDQTADKSHIKINTQGDKYELYQKGDKIESNHNGKFTVKNKEDTQKYKIGIFKNDKLEKVTKVTINNNKNDPQQKQRNARANTQNASAQSKEEEEMEEAINNNKLNISTSNDKVSLSWDSIPDDDGDYEIYRDNEKIGKTSKKHFSDDDVKPNKRYQYQVVAKIEVSEERKKEIEEEVEEQELDLSKKQKKRLYTTEGALEANATIPENDKKSLESEEDLFGNTINSNSAKSSEYPDMPGSDEWKNYIFLYNTFIPYKSVKDKNPLGSKKYPYLRGDNRGFDPFSSSYRTQTKVDTNFTNLSGKSSPSIKGNSSTGTSMRCTNGDCENGEEKTASTDGIEIIKDKENDSTLKWRVKHKVGVPFGKTYPSIWYYYEATVTDAPTVHIEGAHDRAPNHELYIAAQNSDDVMPLMQYEIGNESYFYLLLPGSPQKYFNVTI